MAVGQAYLAKIVTTVLFAVAVAAAVVGLAAHAELRDAKTSVTLVLQFVLVVVVVVVGGGAAAVVAADVSAVVVYDAVVVASAAAVVVAFWLSFYCVWVQPEAS